MKSYRDLDVYKESKSLATSIHKMTRHSLNLRCLKKEVRYADQQKQLHL